jgi:hypothetical protein
VTLRMKWAIAIPATIALFHALATRPPMNLFLAVAVLMTVAAIGEGHAWLCERRERERLIAEADRQHAAWKAGDDDWGVYGVSPLASTERWVA